MRAMVSLERPCMPADRIATPVNGRRGGAPSRRPCRQRHLLATFGAFVVAAAALLVPDAHAMQETRVLGGPGGDRFVDHPPPDVQLISVVIRAGTSVDAVAPVLRRADGTPYTVSLHGGLGGDVNTFRLDKNERLTAMSVWANRSTIDAIQFESNLKRSRIYGTPRGESFRVVVPPGHRVVGFVGRSGAQLNAVGFALQPDWATPRPNPITGARPGGTFRPLPPVR